VKSYVDISFKLYLYCTKDIKTGLPMQVFRNGVCGWWLIVNFMLKGTRRENAPQWSARKPSIGSPHQYPSTLCIDGGGDDHSG